MHALTASTLLSVWERGVGQSSVTQALSLLAEAIPKTAVSELARLPIGRRDVLLLALREQLFGSRVQTVVVCPQCQDHLDLVFEIDQIRVPVKGESQEEFACDDDDYQATFRLPTSEDLLMVVQEPEPGAAKQLLLERCLLRVLHRGEVSSELSTSLTERVIKRMAEVDPQGDVELAVTCAACGHQWQALFDIASFVWREIGAWAKRLLGEVHLLASAYGWAEADILRMSAWRRQCYLDMVQR
jgi:hypothetical protein